MSRNPSGRQARGASRLAALLLGALALSCCWPDASPTAPRSPAPPDASPPQRVVSLAPSCTETIVALGLAKRLVGISDYCPELPEGCSATRVGGLVDLNIEALIVLEPDLIVTVQEADDRGLAALQRQGIAILATNPQSLDAMVAQVTLLGERLGASEPAARLAAQLRMRLDQVRAVSAKLPRRPRVYIEVDYPQCFTVGRRSFVHEAVEAAGGDNIFGDVDQDYFETSKEEIVARAPAIVLILHPIDRPLMERAELALLRDTRFIVDLERDTLLRASPRLVDGIEALAARLAAP